LTSTAVVIFRGTSITLLFPNLSRYEIGVKICLDEQANLHRYGKMRHIYRVHLYSPF
jgi:hypothetical protein